MSPYSDLNSLPYVLLTKRVLQKTCVQDMLDKASDLSCDSGDVGCLCANPDFTYGIRDCSLEACTNDAQAIINYGAEYCKGKNILLHNPASCPSTHIP